MASDRPLRRDINELGIHSGAHLRAQSLLFLQERFGKAGSYYYWISRGIDDRAVTPDRVRKSVGADNTFERDLWTLADATSELKPIIDKVWSFCARTQTLGRTITLKVKYQDFHQITRSRSLSAPIASRDELAKVTFELLGPLFPTGRGIRLLGVTLSRLNWEDAGDECQLPLL
jgi:DNA polymerase IV